MLPIIISEIIAKEINSKYETIIAIENFLQYLVAIRPIFNINILNAIDNIIEIRTNTK